MAAFHLYRTGALPVVSSQGYKSFFAFWMGGAAHDASVIPPPTPTPTPSPLSEAGGVGRPVTQGPYGPAFPDTPRKSMAELYEQFPPEAFDAPKEPQADTSTEQPVQLSPYDEFIASGPLGTKFSTVPDNEIEAQKLRAKLMQDEEDAIIAILMAAM